MGFGLYPVGTKPEYPSASGCGVNGCSANFDNQSAPPGQDFKARLEHGVRQYFAVGEYIYNGGSCTPSASTKLVQKAGTDTAKAPTTDPTGQPSPACSASGGFPGVINTGKGDRPVCLKKDQTSGITGMTPESSPYNAVSNDEARTVTQGSDTAPAGGSMEEYCRMHVNSTMCSKADAATSTNGDLGDGTGTSGTGSTSGSGTGTANGNCTDCAKETTQQQIRDFLNPTGVQGGVGNATTADSAMGGLMSAVDATKSGTGPFSSLDWQFPSIFPPSVECAPLQVTIPGRLNQTATINYCATLALVRACLGWVIYVLTIILVFNIATGRKASTGDSDK